MEKIRKVLFLCFLPIVALAQIPGEYCALPIEISREIPPLVMLVVERDHKLYYEAYNDASDLDGDGVLDVGYKHTIDYYGYFDPYKCYKYEGSGENAKFVPTRRTQDKYCGGGGEWSGNFLNWLSMSRMDVLRKVLYGGKRKLDSSSETVLAGAYIPQDAHSWGKEYSGNDTRLLTPFNKPESGKRHLFCVTSLNDGEEHRIRVLENRPERIWQWASVERPVCGNKIDSNNDGTAETSVSPDDYFVRVKVCDPQVGLEDNCKRYGNNYKPVGLLLKYGEGEKGKKVCSASLKECQTDADCGQGEGLCVPMPRMYFGLITGSYTKNKSGGVLRKNIWEMSDEVNAESGTFQTSENVEGNIILTFDRMKVIDFNYNDYSYANCGWITDGPPPEGKCRMWGNPIAEMMYEAVRYLAGKAGPTERFTYTENQDGGLKLPKPQWGIKKGGRTYYVTDLFPWCSKPFLLVLSDINPSYDSDSLPGSAFGNLAGDLQGLNVSSLADQIGSKEGLSGKEIFIGQSGGNYDTLCSPKNVGSFSQIRGLCPEEPTKEGSYYAASIAYYGRTQFRQALPDPNKALDVYTYAVAMASPLPKIEVGGVTVIPVGKSVSGCYNVYSNCYQKCSVSYVNSRMVISNCQPQAFCPTNQIVDFYILEDSPDRKRFRINFEDVEQGADHDMDAIVEYVVEKTGDSQVKITVNSIYAQGCIDQVLGFFISGTTEDGLYLVVKDKDASGDGDTPPIVASMPLSWNKTFTVKGGSAGLLRDPLWYAAKWGGFDDANQNRLPDDGEWDKDGDGNPDTYFFVANPLELESKLEQAFQDILRRVSSGTAVSVLSTSAKGEGSVFQAYYIPVVYEGAEKRTWLGYLQGLWIDRYGKLREDTVRDWRLVTSGNSADMIIHYEIDPSTMDTVVSRWLDTDGDREEDRRIDQKSLSELGFLWEAGKRLASTDPGERRIFTFLDKDQDGKPDQGEFGDHIFTPTKVDVLRPYLGVEGPMAEKVIRFIRGEHVEGFRDRRITVDGVKRVWKLGDIVHSTPVVVGRPMGNYHLIYGDPTFVRYYQQNLHRRAVVYIGANDGMLHAFNAGFYSEGDKPGTEEIEEGWWEKDDYEFGQELWSFIPYNVLPHLKWLASPDYDENCHIYYVDLKPEIFDARIFPSDEKHPDGWGTLLIGGLRLGGHPIRLSDDFDGDGKKEEREFRSSYFALDVTDPLNPRLLWEFNDPDLGYTTSNPAIMRFGDPKERGIWYVVFGSGPTTKDGESQRTDAFIYVLDLATGNLVLKKSVRQIDPSLPEKVVLASPLTVDLHLDYQVDLIYIGVSYKKTDGSWAGEIIRIKTGESPDPSQWEYGVFTKFDQPITSAPSIAIDESDRLWLYWGTGRYYSKTDQADLSEQRIYGVWDPMDKTIGGADLQDVTPVTVYEYGWVDLDDNGRVDITFSAYLAERRNAYASQRPSYGWYLRLSRGERVLDKPIVVGGTVLLTSFKPSNDICAYGGESYLYALYYETGTAYKEPIVGYGGRTVQVNGQSAQEILKKIRLGTGTPTSVVVHTGQEKGVVSLVQLGTGQVVEVKTNPAFSPKSGTILWREKM